ncbi:hypothetical protein ACJIZ3_009081 [Penstemon smallii]|uniref:Zinc finger GRF-type domain-containing protein n=1 Tax=Penstemon smallii TaxID=265156 RepID=A0ABD3TCC1_9LAMI
MSSQLFQAISADASFSEVFSSFPVKFPRNWVRVPLPRLSPRISRRFHFLAMENHQSSSNSSGIGVSVGGRMCQCGAAVKLYTSYTKMNNGRRFIRCGGVPAHSINPGLLVRVNHLDDENRRMDTAIVAMEAEIRSLNASILELKAANITLLHKLYLVKIFVVYINSLLFILIFNICTSLDFNVFLVSLHKMPLTRSQRAEMAGYFIGRLQAAAREHDIRDVATLRDVCRRRRFSLPSLKYKLARIRKDYHRFNGFLALSGVDYNQGNNIVQIFPNIYWSEINPHWPHPVCHAPGQQPVDGR